MARSCRPGLEALEARTVLTASGERFTAALFPDLFGRLPDQAALSYWAGRIDQGLSRTPAARAMTDSVEFRTSTVLRAYNALLDRTGDGAGVGFHVNLLNGGGTAEQVRASLAGSDEYFQRFGGGTALGFLQALYQDALGRDLDQAGQALYGTELAQGRTRAQVAAEVLGSLAGRQLVVGNLYRQYLRREPDAAGLSFQVAALQNGGEAAVVANLLGSAEYYAASVDARGTPEQTFLGQVYRDQLNRGLDANGQAFWNAALAAGAGRTQVAAQILKSPEARAAAVQRWFQQYLQHPPSSAQVGFFTGLLNSGFTAEAVQNQILATAEYYTGRGGNTDEGFLQALYKDVLGRPLDGPTAGTYTAALADGRATRSRLIANVFSSAEYRNALVGALYQQALRRPADATGLAFHTGSLLRGAFDEDVLASLIGSFEFGDVVENQNAVTFSGQAQATFDAPTPSENAAGAGTALLSWGKPANGSTPSTFRFSGAAIQAPPGREFSLGTLTYHNGQSEVGSEITSVTLTVRVNLAGVAPLTLAVPLSVTTTINNGDPVEDSDTLSVPATFASSGFSTPDGRRYTLKVLGFRSVQGDGSAALNELTVPEDGIKAAQVWGQVVPAPQATVTFTYDHKAVTLLDDVHFDVSVTGAALPIKAYGIEGRRFFENDWKPIAEGPSNLLTVTARLPKTFLLRAYVIDAAGNRYTAPSSYLSWLRVDYPDTNTTLSDPRFAAVKSQMLDVWKATEAHSLPPPATNTNFVQEQGFTILIDTRAGANPLYQVVGMVTGPNTPVTATGPPGIKLKEGTLASFRSLTSVANFAVGETYVYATFHTHTPNLFRSQIRPVGPSIEDELASLFDGLGGYVFDYTATIRSIGTPSIKAHHPISVYTDASAGSAAGIYIYPFQTTNIRYWP